MIKKKAIIHRYGAYGDHIHWSAIPKILSEEGYEVDIDVNFKGLQLFCKNPYVKNIHVFETNNETTEKELKDRWKKLDKEYDKVINLQWSLEYGTISMESNPSFWERRELREKINNNNYYDFTYKWAELYDYIGKGHKGEVYYCEEEHDCIKGFIKDIKEKYSAKFVLLVNLSGTGLHKVYPHMSSVINCFLENAKDAVVITTGDKECQLVEWKHDRVIRKSGIFPFRQSLLLAKYVDGVIGCESGLMVGATMWETPSVQLMTAASLKCHTKYSKNDYSIQSSAYCSPCYRGVYNYSSCCAIDPVYKLPICVMSFKKEDILATLMEIYQINLYCSPVDEININYDFKNESYEIEKLKCPFCKKINNEIVRKSNDEIYYYCDICKIYYTNIENIKKNIYNKFYIDKYIGSELLYSEQFDRYYNIINKIINFESKDFLEVGPINSIISDKFFDKDFNVTILDINKNFKTNYPCINYDFESYDFKDKKFNVIWMSHVFEHFIDPRNSIKKINKLLDINGLVYFSMPSPECIDWRNPLDWDHWHVNEHYILWELESFKKLLVNTGFKIKHEEINRGNRSLPVTGDFNIIAQKIKEIY